MNILLHKAWMQKCMTFTITTCPFRHHDKHGHAKNCMEKVEREGVVADYTLRIKLGYIFVHKIL